MKNTVKIYCVIKQAYLCDEQCLKQTFSNVRWVAPLKPNKNQLAAPLPHWTVEMT